MKTQRESLETSARIGRQLIEEKKEAVRMGEASLEKGKGVDLLSMVGEQIPTSPHACKQGQADKKEMSLVHSPSEHGPRPQRQPTHVRRRSDRYDSDICACRSGDFEHGFDLGVVGVGAEAGDSG